MRIAISLLCVLLSGCERPEVAIECIPGADGFTCSLEQTAGSVGTNTCWTIRVECQNGAVVESRKCRDTQPRGKSSVLVRESEFDGIDSCDEGVGVSVVNMSVEPR